MSGLQPDKPRTDGDLTSACQITTVTGGEVSTTNHAADHGYNRKSGSRGGAHAGQ